MEVDITVKDLKKIPGLVADYVRDKVVDYLKSKIDEGLKDVEHVRMNPRLCLFSTNTDWPMTVRKRRLTHLIQGLERH